MSGTTSAIIAHEQKALVKIFEIVKRAYDNLPEVIKPITNADNVNELRFEYRYDGAKLDSGIYVALKVRSGTVQNLHITEVAYIKDKQELAAGSKQAVPLTGRISEETTGNGYEQFYDSYIEAQRVENPGDMEYKTYFYAWFENPEYRLNGEIDELSPQEQELQQKYNLSTGQLLWRRWKMKELQTNSVGMGLSGEQLFKQEYPSTVAEAFQSGAGNVFDAEKLEKITPLPPLTPIDINRILTVDWENKGPQERADIEVFMKKAQDMARSGLWMWQMPVIDREYVVGVDPSDGQGADFGVISVWTRKPDPESGKLRQVAQYYGKLLPDDLAQMAVDIAVFYNRAFMGVENNMISTILFVSKLYDNIFMKVTMDERTQKKTRKLGWNTNVQTREKMIDDYLIHHTEDLLDICSRVSISEMFTFVRKQMPSGAFKREHADGKWDDALFADMIALQMALYERPTWRAVAKQAYSSI